MIPHKRAKTTRFLKLSDIKSNLYFTAANKINKKIIQFKYFFGKLL